MPSGRPAGADESPSGLPRAFRPSDDPPTVQRTSVGPMIQDVTGFQRAEMTCLWGDELETPVGMWRGGGGPAGRGGGGGGGGFHPAGGRPGVMPAGGTAGGSALPLGRHAAIERTGRRGQRVWVRRGVSPPCAAES